MSEEEYSGSEYEEEEEEEEVEEVEEEVAAEEEEAEEEEESTPAQRPTRVSESGDGGKLNEAESAMLAAKKRHDNDDEAKLMDYEERRKMEREKEEEELRKLKEKQEKRKLEREQEEREAAERKQRDEERRKQEEEDRRARAEEEKRKKEEEKTKRAAMMGAPFTQQQGGGRNFTIQPKSDKGDKFGNIVQAKQEMGMTKEQQEEAKQAFILGITQGIPDSSGILPADLKAKIKELHHRICKMEAEKYDQEKRHERQIYDLRELNERSRQVARNNNMKGGVDPSDANGRHPPKVQILSKYDRQIDRRNFKERRNVYETKHAFPCFPGVPPPPALFDKIIAKYDHEIQEEQDAADQAAYEEEYGEDEEEEEEEE